MNKAQKAERYAVDRREGKYFVLERADGVVLTILATKLPESCRVEGAVIDVPPGPEWTGAKRNPKEEERRRNEMQKRLEQLKRYDPGDVER